MHSSARPKKAAIEKKHQLVAIRSIKSNREEAEPSYRCTCTAENRNCRVHLLTNLLSEGRH